MEQVNRNQFSIMSSKTEDQRKSPLLPTLLLGRTGKVGDERWCLIINGQLDAPVGFLFCFAFL